MKKILGLVMVLAALALGTGVFGAAFTPGNVVVYRIGDGTQPITNAGQTVFLDEYTTNDIATAVAGGGPGPFGSPIPVQSIQMPTNWYGGNAPLIAEGPGNADGQMTLSQDGRFLVLTGYGATLSGGASPSYQLTNSALSSSTVTGFFNTATGIFNPQVARVVGLVDGPGHIYTTTVQTNANEEGDDPRAAASIDGTNIWLAGSANRVKYLIRGSAISTQVVSDTTLSPLRAVNIFGNKLYIDKSTELASPTNTSPAVNLIGGTALPTSSIPGNFLSVPGVYTGGSGSAFGIAMFNLNGGTNPDTLYVADSQTNFPGEPLSRGGGILKFCFMTNTWVYEGEIGAEDAYGVTGFKNVSGSSTSVTLYITEATNQTLYTFTDTFGFGGQIPPNDINQSALPTFLIPATATNGTLINIRGVAVVPQGGDSGTISGPGVLSIGPPFGPNFSGPSGGPFTPASYTYTVANLGTTTTNFVSSVLALSGGSFVTVTPPSGTLPPGTSMNVTVTPNATATGDTGGFTYQNRVLFKNGSAGGTTFASPVATLVDFALYVTPTSNFISTAAEPGGGPYVPSFQVYTISNATASSKSWSVFTSNTWTSVSASSGTLAGLASTNITVSINSNANVLAIGTYQDMLVVSNTSANVQLTTRTIDLQIGFGIFDDFGSSAYVSGPVVGQNNWLSSSNPDNNNNPVQISGGKFVVPGGCVNNAGTSQQPYKYVAAQVFTNTVANPNAYGIFGMSITFTNGSPSPNYTFEIGSTDLGLADSGIEDKGGTQYVWTVELNQFETGGGTVGTIQYNYFTNYLVFIVTDVADSNAWVFVNPGTDSFDALTNQTPAAYSIGGGCNFCPGDSPGFNSITAGQYSSCPNEVQQGYMISKLAASTNYTDVYDFLAGISNAPPTDPFSTWQSHYFTGVGELANPAFSGPGADPLGKGMSNTNQFLAGFNPTNAAAYLHIINITKTNSNTDIRVDYLGASGDSTYSPGFTSRTNVLEFTAGSGGNYNSNSFASTGVTNILSGGVGLGMLTNMVDPGGATNKPSRYYRVRVLVP